ncbi:MAG: M23 family metallopeptidase [Heliobacteriaceae bacterium]|nr:M23 family metallopeptidase [Heliobacteriaceae bacterium]MDD4588022.1 M23 family metallopeptidase [Heliobacteriaceae bacterium]
MNSDWETNLEQRRQERRTRRQQRCQARRRTLTGLGAFAVLVMLTTIFVRFGPALPALNLANATPPVPAEILCNDQPVVKLASYAEAKDVIEQVIAHFTTGQEKEGRLVEFKVINDVAIREGDSGGLPLSTPEAAYESLISLKQEPVIYEVQQGDVLSAIAENQRIPMMEIIESNPGLDPDKLQIGQTLKLVKPVYHITIESKFEIDAEEAIPFGVEEVYDPQLGWGKTETRREGQPGKRKATYILTKANCEVVNQELTAETAIEEPVARLVARGDRYIVASRGPGQFSWPVPSRKVSSPFGSRWGGTHHGVDFYAGIGTPIAATAAGVVTFAGWNGLYGKEVIISHGNGLESVYAHLNTILVGPGQRVEQGENIGRSGATGRVTGPHLHFEIKVAGSHRDPLELLR